MGCWRGGEVTGPRAPVDASLRAVGSGQWAVGSGQSAFVGLRSAALAGFVRPSAVFQTAQFEPLKPPFNRNHSPNLPALAVVAPERSAVAGISAAASAGPWCSRADSNRPIAGVNPWGWTSRGSETNTFAGPSRRRRFMSSRGPYRRHAAQFKRNSPTSTVAGGLVGQTSTRCRSSSNATRHFWPSQSSVVVC